MSQPHDRLLAGLRIIDAGQVLAGPQPAPRTRPPPPVYTPPKHPRPSSNPAPQAIRTQ